MYNKYHTKGIVLKNFEIGDSSKKIQIFTDELGLITAKVQSARNLYSKMRSSIQDYAFCSLSLVRGKNEWKIVSAQTHLNIYENFKSEPEKLFVLLNILNLVKKLSGEEVQNKKVFEIIENFLEYIKFIKKDKVALLECLVLLKILHIFGYMRNDPDFLIPINSVEISETDLAIIAPRRQKVVQLINESLKISNLM